MQHKYGYFSQRQIDLTKQSIRKSIFFLLLFEDPNTKQEYQYINVNEAFVNLLNRLGGLNKLLYEPSELVTIMSLLEQALSLYDEKDFNFKLYRKLLLDAGSEVLKIKGGD